MSLSINIVQGKNPVVGIFVKDSWTTGSSLRCVDSWISEFCALEEKKKELVPFELAVCTSVLMGGGFNDDEIERVEDLYKPLVPQENQKIMQLIADRSFSYETYHKGQLFVTARGIKKANDKSHGSVEINIDTKTARFLNAHGSKVEEEVMYFFGVKTAKDLLPISKDLYEDFITAPVFDCDFSAIPWNEFHSFATKIENHVFWKHADGTIYVANED